MIKALSVIGLLVADAALTGVAANAQIILPDRQYRYCVSGPSPASEGGCGPELCQQLQKSGQPACSVPKDIDLSEVVSGQSSTGTPWKIAFLEYNDKGKRWDLAQRAIVKAVIEEARQGNRPVTVLMYVHGWQNNAYLSGDVDKFQAYVKTYAEHVTSSDTPRRMVGVYLAWRGRSLNISPVVDWLSFWTRGFTAGVVGTGDLRDDVTCIAGWGKDPLGVDGKLGDCIPGPSPGSPPPPLRMTPKSRPPEPVDISQQNRVILKGHSFGGRILDHAFLSKSNKGTIQANECSSLESRTPVLAKLDLFMLENAATGGINVWRQLDDCQPCKNRNKGCSDYVASTADYTKSVMARSPAFSGVPGHPTICTSAVSKHERCQPYPLVLSISGKHDLLTRLLLPIATLGQIPAAFIVPLMTHEAVGSSAASKPNVTKGQLFKFQTDSGDVFMFERKNAWLSPKNATNPIWTLEVDSSIIKDHGDVWNPTILNLEMNLMNFGNPAHAPENKATDPNDPRFIRHLPTLMKNAN
jgi:hypothetical protein